MTSPAAISPATLGTKETLPGMDRLRDAESSSVIRLFSGFCASSLEYTTFRS